MKRLYMSLILMPLAIIFFVGCATTRATSREVLYEEDTRYPETDPAEINIFQKVPEQFEYIEIGEITVENARDWEEVENIFKVKAAEYGGDAVYIFKTTEHHRRYAKPRVYFHFGYAHRHGYYSHRYHNHRHHHYYRNHYPYRHGYGYGMGYGYRYDYYEYAYLTVTGIVIKFV